MEKLKVPHDQFGDHSPFIGKPTLVDAYEFKATLKFTGIDMGRTVTIIRWQDTVTHKQYYSDAYLLQAILEGQMNEEVDETSFNRAGLFITARFGFQQKGDHVLMDVLPPSPISADKDTVIEFAKETFEGIMNGKLNLRNAKVHARAFLEYLNKVKDESNDPF